MSEKSYCTGCGVPAAAGRVKTIRLTPLDGCSEKPVSPLCALKETPDASKPAGATHGSLNNGLFPQYSKTIEPNEAELAILNRKSWFTLALGVLSLTVTERCSSSAAYKLDWLKTNTGTTISSASAAAYTFWIFLFKSLTVICLFIFS